MLEKHPDGTMPTPEVLLAEKETDETCFDIVIFERITGESIKQAAMRTHGAAGRLMLMDGVAFVPLLKLHLSIYPMH